MNGITAQTTKQWLPSTHYRGDKISTNVIVIVAWVAGTIRVFRLHSLLIYFVSLHIGIIKHYHKEQIGHLLEDGYGVDIDAKLPPQWLERPNKPIRQQRVLPGVVHADAGGDVDGAVRDEQPAILNP